MKKSWYQLLATAVLLVLCLVAAGCGQTTTSTESTSADTTAGNVSSTSTASTAAQTKIVLKYAFFAPEHTFAAEGMKWWAEEMNRRTNGVVEVEMFFAGTLLTAQNMYDGVLQGVADIGLSCTTYEPGRFPVLGLNDLPGLYKSTVGATTSVFEAASETKPKELDQFYVVGLFANEPGYIMTTADVGTLAQLKGLEIRSGGGPKILGALGASEVAMPISDVPQSLATGVIDGLLCSRDSITEGKYIEYVKYGLDKPLGVVTFLAAMSRAKYDSLPDSVKEVMDELQSEYSIKTAEIHKMRVEASLAEMNKQGFKFNSLGAEDTQSWDAAVAKVRSDAIAQAAAQGYDAQGFYDLLAAKAAQHDQ